MTDPDALALVFGNGLIENGKYVPEFSNEGVSKVGSAGFLRLSILSLWLHWPQLLQELNRSG